ncbi:MAG: adenylate/guanylate cyclase domain-containing protein [Spirochaetes bacterium]|nr:adenylate/guanylate cyclase domain-containing protein [Spirochaetota bacterium]
MINFLKNLFRFSDDFERQVEIEIMKSERLRASFLALVALVFSCFIMISGLLFPEKLPQPLSNKRDVFMFGGILFIFFLYEFIFSRFIDLFIRKNKKFPQPSRYMNAFLEVSFPSSLIFTLYVYYGPMYAFYSPASFVYFLIISLSILRLDYRLSLFTGFVAFVEYILIALYVYFSPLYRDSDPILIEPSVHVLKAVFVLLSGAVSAFIAYQIKKRLINLFKSREERNRITGIFGQYVSQGLVEKLLDMKPELKGETRSVCIMFLDIRNFTSFSQNRDPEEVISYLNSLFGFMVDIINLNGGLINKFLGDGFMALFGVPEPTGTESLDAVRASIGILEAIDEKAAAKTIPPTEIGIGIHSGTVVAGNVGSETRREYTIIGDSVNLASRIEQLNKEFGSRILVSGEAWNSIPPAERKNITGGTEPEKLGPVAVKGRTEPVTVFRVR